MNELWRQIRVLLRRDTFASDLEEEMQAHLEMQASDNEANGMSAEAARFAAKRQFGNRTYLAEESRAAWGWTAVERTLRDARFGLRLLGRNRGFTAAAVLTLALGIGANTAVFSVVDAFLFRPARFPGSERLVSIASRSAAHANRPISFPNFLDWQRENQVFERMAAYRVRTLVIADEQSADRLPALEVSSGFFEILRMQPAFGRIFVSEEHRLGGSAVAMISYEYWQRRYGGDAGVLGKTIAIGDDRAIVVGVAAAAFRLGPRSDVYVPLERTATEGRGSGNSLYAVGRLKPGVTVDQARSHMASIARRLEELYPKTNQGQGIDLVRFGQLRRGEMRPVLLMLMGAVALVLLIACANISNLLLARGVGRGREVAIRRALGASRPRLIAQLLTESVLLSVAGGAAGLLAGFWASRALVALMGNIDDWPGGAPLGGIGIDARVFAFTLAVALFTGLAMGLVPALRASRATIAMRTRAKEGRRLLDVLVAAEVSLALVLLCGAGLLTRSLYHLVNQDRGFDASRVLTLSLARAGGRAPGDSFQRVLEEVQSIRGVEAAAAAFPLPFGHGYSGDTFRVEGRPQPIECVVHQVTPDYFRTLAMRLRSGRWIAAPDRDRAVVINEVLAREAWPGQDAVGKRFRFGGSGSRSDWVTVVGIAADTKESGLEESTGPEAYKLISGGRDLLVRTAGDPLRLASAIRARIRAVDPSLAIYELLPLEQRITESVWASRSLAWLLGIFAVLALVLAAIGIYAVIAHSVSRRTNELGIRMALGARTADVRRLVLLEGLLPAAAGLMFGLAGAWACTRLLGGFLFGVTPADPLTYAGVSSLLFAVAAGACWIPARRATKIDPIQALRYE